MWRNKTILCVGGVLLIVIGMTLVLLWWPDIESLFRGISGMSLALVGLLMLYFARE